MKTKLLPFAITVLVTLVIIPVVFARKDSKEAALVREAKITMTQARKTALARVPGNVEFSKLERGKGGKLLFEFEIHTTEKHESEVHIDAITGEVFKVTEESGKVSSNKNAMLTNAKISFDEAESTALGRVNGAVVFAAIEKERGKVLYEFEIITADGKESTVHVDSATGQVEGVKQD
jgi:uncharacterized membrane protein YkoI